MVASVILRILRVFCVRSFQPFPLGDGIFYFGTAPWYSLSRCTWPQTSSNELNNPVRFPAARVAARVSVRRRFQHELKRELILRPSDMPEMLIPHTSNRLIVFRHDPMTYSYRAAGERLVLQTWHMSGPFAPDPRRENCESLRGDSGRAPARHLADDPSARKQFRPARPSRRVRWWYGHGDKGLSGTFRHRSWRMSTKLWAWVSRTPATVRSVRRMTSTTFTMSSSRLGKTRRDSCRCLNASCWRRGMKSCSYLCFGFILRVALFPQCFIWRIFYLFGSALACIDECEESSPCSAHPS